MNKQLQEIFEFYVNRKEIKLVLINVRMYISGSKRFSTLSDT